MTVRIPLAFLLGHLIQFRHSGAEKYTMGLPSDILQMNIGQIFQTSAIPTHDLSGQTIIVTGANTGLGLEAAKHL